MVKLAFKFPNRRLRSLLPTLTAALILASTSLPATAQSEASVALSLLPVASVAVTGVAASGAAGALSAAPIILSTVGAIFVIKAIEITAKGTVYILERASDGARVSVEILGTSIKSTAISVGATVTASVIGAGIVLSAAGQVIAFIPNELGKALLYSERLTY
jgi:hypothetical protein